MKQADQEATHETKPSLFRKVTRVLQPLILIVALFFIAKYFYQNWGQIQAMGVQINGTVFILSLVVYILYTINLSALFHYITVLDGCSIPLKEAMPVYLYSILGKYIPGKVFMLAARMPAYEARGKRLSELSFCFVLENVFTLMATGLLFLVSLLTYPNDQFKPYIGLCITLIIAFFICIHPKIVNWALKTLFRLLKKEPIQVKLSYRQMVTVIALFFANWLLVGAGFYMLACSVYPLAINTLLYTGGIFGIALFIGVLAIFAPSGVGVREGIMILGLSVIMPNEYAVIISVISRLWATIGELTLALGSGIYLRIRNKRHKGE